MRIGRFQETLALPAIPDKSLDRKDSDSTGISYSDGISAEYPVGGGWNLLGIAQYAPDGGATNRPREPLSFDDDENPVSGYFAVRRSDDDRPVGLASLSYSVYPKSLVENGQRENHSGLVANAMRRIPVEGLGTLLIGGSLGYAPDIPQSASASSQSHAGLASNREPRRLRTAGSRDSASSTCVPEQAGSLSPDLATGDGSRKPATGSGRYPG